jgi:DNA-damage-inducible protein D
MTSVNVQRENHRGETAISREHVQNSASVRNMLGERGIKPEELPAEEDIAKVERRVRRDEKELSKKPLPPENA